MYQGFKGLNIFFRWGFLPVYGDDEYLSICEMPIEEVGKNRYPPTFIILDYNKPFT